MPSGNNKETIKITLEDLANVSTPETAARSASAAAPALGTKSYGSVSADAEQPSLLPEEHGSILLQGWFYLGAAGFVGALIGWGICEPGFVDGTPGVHRWGNIWLIPVMVTFMCFGFSVAESIVERSVRKALVRASLSVPLGIILGFIFYVLANIMYSIGIGISLASVAQTINNPALWIARGLAWMVFGAAGGVVYGIVGQSTKKLQYGVLGGVIGAGIGGFLFDPISFLTHGGGASRAVGLSLFGLSTGIAMGLVESALKDRWLYVTSGPLAGKQFILYKPRTVIGSQQQSDIYLFKDSTILPQHAVVEINGARVQIRAAGQTYVSGQPVQVQALQSGAVVQIGRYGFRYQEKQRK